MGSLTLRLLVPRADSTCKHCKVRWTQQQKYLKEAYELYGEVRDFFVSSYPAESY